MPRSASDLKDIPTREFDRLRTEELIALVDLGRVSENGSDKQRARAAWEALVLGEMDRVRQLVKAFEFPNQPGVRVDRDDVDDAVQESFTRLIKMFAGFRGASAGEFHAALYACVKNACMDYCRKEMRLDKRRGGSLDESIESEDGSSRGRFDHEIADQERERIEAGEGARQYYDRIAQALDAIDSDDMQAVLRMTWEGASVAQIAAELGASTDNVYQLRSRGMRKIDAALTDGSRDDGNG